MLKDTAKRLPTHQLAILWHAASSMGPPWLMKDGASLEMRVSNNEGYARCVNTTIDVYICVRLSESASVSEVFCIPAGIRVSKMHPSYE